MNQQGAIGAVLYDHLQGYVIVSCYAMAQFNERNLRRDLFNDRWKNLGNVQTGLGRYQNCFIRI